VKAFLKCKYRARLAAVVALQNCTTSLMIIQVLYGLQEGDKKQFVRSEFSDVFLVY